MPTSASLVMSAIVVASMPLRAITRRAASVSRSRVHIRCRAARLWDAVPSKWGCMVRFLPVEAPAG